eukprot:TRINITY_DN7131_c0_g1_i2.p1 TRINITY_DN7131_c0_g1~~TRINITY_DN7131_c0_g1_i2.p1  ORF type:complete len:443 (-),score=39.73 TRINITY_DN7131_c0_g1_i2:144-1472(-)
MGSSHSTTRFGEEIDSDNLTSSVSHLVVFVHGFGSSGPQHGVHFKSEFDRQYGPAQQVYICHSNSSYTGVMTFYKTSAGIAVGGQRICDEVREVVSRHPHITKVSFVGSSLGGLYSRYAVNFLFGQESCLPAHIRPGAFLTLASPHLGVRGLYHSMGQSLINWITSGAELMLQDSTESSDFSRCLLCQMASPPYTDILRKFPVRVSYAPLVDDGIVSYVSSVFSDGPRFVLRENPQEVIGKIWNTLDQAKHQEIEPPVEEKQPVMEEKQLVVEEKQPAAAQEADEDVKLAPAVVVAEQEKVVVAVNPDAKLAPEVVAEQEKAVVSVSPDAKSAPAVVAEQEKEVVAVELDPRSAPAAVVAEQEQVIVRVRPDAWFAGDEAAEALLRAVENLRAVNWTVVEVGVDHKRLATLYPSTPERPNPWTEAILRDLFPRLTQVYEANH